MGDAARTAVASAGRVVRHRRSVGFRRSVDAEATGCLVEPEEERVAGRACLAIVPRFSAVLARARPSWTAARRASEEFSLREERGDMLGLLISLLVGRDDTLRRETLPLQCLGAG
jgi:hypothetical protein